VDAGTRVYNTWEEGAALFGYYFAAGGIDVNFDGGWRQDGAGLASIYWRVTGTDNFGIANGTINNATVAGSNGAEIMLDNQACKPDNNVSLTARNMRMEVDSSMNPGMGIFTMLDCPSAAGAQFRLDLEGTYEALGANGNYAPGFVMTPANDTMLNLTIVNGTFPTGTVTPYRFVGLPQLSRYDQTGSSGVIPFLTYSPPLKSDGVSGSMAAYTALAQLIGDTNIDNLYQKGVPASAFLFSDTAYTALPNGTTLNAGQILAPPVYWRTGSSTSGRYAIQGVQQPGTIGSPNGGNTTCSSDGIYGHNWFTVSSTVDLSVGQYVSCSTATNKTIQYVDATNPTSALVYLTSSIGAAVNGTLSFSAPVLGLELQLPTKSSAAPTAGTWSQGDVARNSAATANGVAEWVNVAAGAPGSWAGVPLGNASGKLSASQVVDTPSTSPECPNGPGGTLTTSGCAGSSGSVSTLVPTWLQYLGNGANGANTNASGSLYGEYFYTNFTVPAGNVLLVGTVNRGLVVHATGTCTINGIILANGAVSLWNGNGIAGGASGGSGGGSSAGSAGKPATFTSAAASGGILNQAGGAAGAASGAAGGNGSAPASPAIYATENSGLGMDGVALFGAAGVQGANSGGAGGNAGGSVVLICQQITGTGVIDVSGGIGNPPAANSTGAGSGGGGGVVILSSQTAVSSWPTIYTGGGAGGQVSVPYAVPAGISSMASGNNCATQPRLSLTVSGGALSGCAVAVAGAGCGSAPSINWAILGGGGTGGTITPTWSGGAVASCTASGGSGYTATSYTSAGTGGDGGQGWYAEFQGW
jgi:hypothetical protein